MFVENCRLETMIGGQAQTVIPYPRISDEDWSKWKAFLPVKSALLSKKVLLNNPDSFLHTAFRIPSDVYHELVRGADYFEAIEIWRKREIRKDPIAVGLTGNGERYLIYRWGLDRLIPFETIKSRSLALSYGELRHTAGYFGTLLAVCRRRNDSCHCTHRNVVNALQAGTKDGLWLNLPAFYTLIRRTQ